MWNKLPSEILHLSWFDYHINTFATLQEIQEQRKDNQQEDLEPSNTEGVYIGETGCRLS